MPTLNVSSYSLGLIFILLVAIIWSFASVVVQYLYREVKFDAPFLLTYIGTSLFVVQIPLHRLYERCVSNSMTNSEYDSIPTINENEEGTTISSAPVAGDTDIINGENNNPVERNIHWTANSAFAPCSHAA